MEVYNNIIISGRQSALAVGITCEELISDTLFWIKKKGREDTLD